MYIMSKYEFVVVSIQKLKKYIQISHYYTPDGFKIFTYVVGIVIIGILWVGLRTTDCIQTGIMYSTNLEPERGTGL